MRHIQILKNRVIPNMRFWMLVFVVLLSGKLNAQALDSLSIEWFYQKIEQNYPLAQQREMISERRGLKNEALNRTLLPALILNSKANYSSDVIQFPGSPNSESPLIPKDQYAVNLDVRQPIYQGGIVPIQKKIESSVNDEQIISVESKLLDVKTRLADIYFLILFNQKQLEINILIHNELIDRIKIAQSAYNNGALLSSDLDALKAEKIKMEQQIHDQNATLVYLFSTLSTLSGIELDTSAQLVLSDTSLNLRNTYNRPEYDIYENNVDRLDLNSRALTAYRLPKVYGSAEAGYGNPGMNILSGGWDTYFFVGATLSWDIYDWGRTHKEKQILAVNQDIIQNNREVYDVNLSINVDKSLSSIVSLQSQLKMDFEMEALYNNIIKNAASQLDQGAITTVDYLVKLNRSMETKIRKEMHTIQLAQSIMNYNLLTGKYYNNGTQQ